MHLCYCAIYALSSSSVFCISIPSTRLPHTRSTESCDFWSLLTPHHAGDTAGTDEKTGSACAPTSYESVSMSAYFSKPPKYCVSHDPHKDQVAGSRETTALVRPFNVGLHVCLVNKECTLHTTFGMLFISSHWSCLFLPHVFSSIGYLVKYLHNVRKVWHCSHTLNKVLVCHFRWPFYCN